MIKLKSAPLTQEWGIVWRPQKGCGDIVFVDVGQQLYKNVINLLSMGEIFHQVIDVAPRQLA